MTYLLAMCIPLLCEPCCIHNAKDCFNRFVLAAAVIFRPCSDPERCYDSQVCTDSIPRRVRSRVSVCHRCWRHGSL
jgi:hypothetical protein